MCDIEVSFIVAIYNIEKYVEECIKSICLIRSDKIEIILVNDGSTDSSLSICEKYSELDGRIKIISQKNKGLPEARNAGLKKAQGKWVCFVDGDDCLSDQFEEKIMKALNPEVDIICFLYKAFNRKKGKNNPLTTDRKVLLKEKEIEELRKSIMCTTDLEKKKFYNQNIMYTATWGKIYKRESIIKGKIDFAPQAAWGEDVIFTFKILKIVNRLEIIDSLGYWYRVQEESMTQKYSECAIENYLKFMFEMKKEVDKEVDKEYLQNFWTMSAKQYLTIVRRNIFNKHNPYSLAERKQFFIETKNIELIKEAYQKADYNKFNWIIKVGAILCKYNKFYLLDLLYKIQRIKDAIKYGI